MIVPGLVSVTFRGLPPEQVIALVGEAGLSAIEWSGDCHVPRGAPDRAAAIGAATAEAGLSVAGFGSYYRIGRDEGKGYRFDVALADAVALGAPAIRVWAGGRGAADADDAYRAMVVEESRRMADLAATAGIRLVYEYHDGTLTDTDASAARLLREVGHPNVGTLWQPHNGVDPVVNLAGLRELLPWVHYLHVFHWWPTHEQRHPLAEGEDRWLPYLETMTSAGRDVFSLMEFVPGDAPDAFLRDAAVLQSWAEKIG